MKSIICPHCNATTPAPAQFCRKCGEPFQAAPEQPQDPSLQNNLPAASPPAFIPLETPLHTVPETPQKPPSRRSLKPGWIVLLILLCLGSIAVTITGVVFLDEIKELLGLTRATPVAEVVPALISPPTSTRTPTPPEPPAPSPTITSTATLPPPRRLTICSATEPEDYYLYGATNLAKQHVLEAVYDGPFDHIKYDYYAVILEKMPSLADGDALILRADVSQGDLVVNDDLRVVTLSNGELVRPAGCRSSDCAITYNGGSLQMDFMQVTFSLLPGLTWSDGTPLTAADSVFSFYLNGDPDTDANKYVYNRTAEYRATGDLTAIWISLPGYLDNNYHANFWSPLPQHVLGMISAADMSYTDLEHLLLGWGPYIFEDHIPGEQISFTRNPAYFRASEGLPVFQELVIRFIGDDGNAAVANLLSGECDLLSRDIPLADQGQLLLDKQVSGALNAVIWSDQYYEHLDFNLKPVDTIVNSGAFAGWDLDGDGVGPFGDIRLRQAVAYCLDRQAVVDEVYLGQVPPANTILPPDHPLMAPSLPDLTYDPQAGMALLNEIGWIDEDGNAHTPRIAQGVTGVPDGTPLTFSYESTTAPQRIQALAILAESLAQCGFGVNVAHWPTSEWLAGGSNSRLLGRQFDLGQYAWGSSFGIPCQVYMSNNIPGDPDEVDAYGNILYPNGWDGQNDSGYSSPQFDAACNLAIQTLPGEPGYVENTWEVQYILAHDLPIIPLYTRFLISATRADFCNFTPASAYYSELWNLEEFAYGTACP